MIYILYVFIKSMVGIYQQIKRHRAEPPSVKAQLRIFVCVFCPIDPQIMQKYMRSRDGRKDAIETNFQDTRRI